MAAAGHVRRSVGQAAVLAVAAMILAMAGTGSALAGPPGIGEPTGEEQPAASGALSIGDVLTGGGAVTATATSNSGADDMVVVLEAENASGAPASLEVAPGTLLASDDPSEQTTVLGGAKGHPEFASIVEGGGTPTLSLPPGTSTQVLEVYCAQKNDLGPFEPTPMSYVGMARDPLPQVMQNIVATEPDSWSAQEAVWWVTDNPDQWIADPALFEGVDTAAFAADPVDVVPDAKYTPEWAGGTPDVFPSDAFSPGRPGDGGSHDPAALLAILLVVGVAGLWYSLHRNRRTRARTALAATTSPWDARPTTGLDPGGPVGAVGQWPPGWYPDPWRPTGQRWWDGSRFTNHTA